MILEIGEPSYVAPAGDYLHVAVRAPLGTWGEVVCISPADMEYRLKTDKGCRGIPVAYARIAGKIMFWPRPAAAYPVGFQIKEGKTKHEHQIQ